MWDWVCLGFINSQPRDQKQLAKCEYLQGFPRIVCGVQRWWGYGGALGFELRAHVKTSALIRHRCRRTVGMGPTFTMAQILPPQDLARHGSPPGLPRSFHGEELAKHGDHNGTAYKEGFRAHYSIRTRWLMNFSSAKTDPITSSKKNECTRILLPKVIWSQTIGIEHWLSNFHIDLLCKIIKLCCRLIQKLKHQKSNRKIQKLNIIK